MSQGATVGAPVAVAPYCRWSVGDDGYVALTVLDGRSITRLRRLPELADSDVADLGDGAFFAVDKTLYVGALGSSYVLEFQRGAEWTNAFRAPLVDLAREVIDRVGFVPPPLPPADPAVSEPETRTSETSTTTVPTPTTKPPTLLPEPAAPAAPTDVIDTRRPLSTDRPLRVWAGGDSTASGPAWAVAAVLRPTGVAQVVTESRVGTGLSRPDFFDWGAHLAAVGDTFDPEVMVLFFGGNDVQPLVVPNGGLVTYGTAEWASEHRRRIDVVMDAVAVRGRRILWVGLPPMREPVYAAQMSTLNELYRGEASRRPPWAVYADISSVLSPAGQPGVFAAELPDASGTPQRVRIDDIHLNEHGSEVLAADLVRRLRTFTALPVDH